MAHCSFLIWYIKWSVQAISTSLSLSKEARFSGVRTMITILWFFTDSKTKWGLERTETRPLQKVCGQCGCQWLVTFGVAYIDQQKTTDFFFDWSLQLSVVAPVRYQGAPCKTSLSRFSLVFFCVAIPVVPLQGKEGTWNCLFFAINKLLCILMLSVHMN